ncbi:hypothetical protein C8J56DRAFT_889506 [Mycena floridula]|nr:hypothetical protein C8J56DRAFT_889506 [Mycena floridula]
MAEKTAKLSSSEEQAARLTYSIPIGIESQLLPSKNVSLRSLCDFKLPSPTATLYTHSPVDFFFFKEAPTLITPAMLRKLLRHHGRTLSIFGNVPSSQTPDGREKPPPTPSGLVWPSQ